MKIVLRRLPRFCPECDSPAERLYVMREVTGARPGEEREPLAKELASPGDEITCTCGWHALIQGGEGKIAAVLEPRVAYHVLGVLAAFYVEYDANPDGDTDKAGRALAEVIADRRGEEVGRSWVRYSDKLPSWKE